MADANLLEILDRESKLDNMIIYGNVRCAIEKPSYLSNSILITDGFFALVDVLALKCNGVDYFSSEAGYEDSKHIYFSKGSIVVAITDRSLIGKNVKVYGRTSKGCTIKRQRATNNRDGVVAFAWTKNNGKWCIVPNKVFELGDKDAKGTVLEDYLISLVNGGTFRHPDSINSLAEYYGDKKAKPIKVDNISGGMDYSTTAIDLTKIPLNLTYRLGISEKSAYIDMVKEAVDELRKKSKEFSKDIIRDIRYQISEESEGELDCLDVNSVALEIIDSFVANICVRYNLPLSNISKVKGKDFVDSFLDEVQSVKFRNNEDSEDEEEKVKDLYKIIEGLKKRVALSPEAMSLENMQIPILRDHLKYASLIIGEITGIGLEDIVSNYNSTNLYNEMKLDEWFWCLIRNPYLCGLLGGSLSIVDCDRIFYSFSQDYDIVECKKYRDMLLMLDAIKNASDRSTLINKNALLKSVNKYPKRGTRYVEDNGAPFSKNCLVAISQMKGVVVEVSLEELGMVSEANKVLKDLNELGVLEEVNDGVILTSDLYKESKIYLELYKKGNTLTGIEDKDIEETVERFESMKGFKLESLQKDGIQLIKRKAGVLSGCAGSGKTTTSDCMVEGIKSYLPNYILRFGAPTGKAARRLAEVVGGGVKTIHSMFGLGLSSEPYITSRSGGRRKNSEGGSYAYILDEMAMCNTSLMYEIVRNLQDEDLIYFLGDIKQLSPIGKGTPFRSLMKYLPCVELGVSKRAAENGKINYNCGLINFVSDDSVVELQEGEDFLINPCSDADIQLETVNMFRNLLFKYNEDDIQVVTGYQTDKYPWSTVQLNPMLQDLLRNPNELLYVYNEQKYMKNDRVIHVKRNAYDMPRYRMVGNSTFEEVATFGVVNGELGKILGYVRSDDCTIFKWSVPEYSEDEWASLDRDTKEIIEKRKNTSVDIRDESLFKDEKVYFVIVQVYDVDLKENVVVLYHANYKEELSNDYYAKTFSGGDLKYLDLAYALTTHKMQGSQSPAIIVPLGSSSSSSFMNRNMLNTMFTRASEVVGLIGSVRGANSALTNGRRVTNIDDGEDVLGLLTEE